MPVFFEEGQVEASAVLKEHYPVIRDEVLSFFENRFEEVGSNFTPYNYYEKGWRTVNLYTYGIRYPENCAKFPEVDRIVCSIPGMTMAQVAILEPGVRIKAHLGDTSGIIRTHLGIQIPGQLPDIGMRIGRKEICWEEGKTFSFCIVHRHFAWNSTEGYRIALVVDTIHPDYKDRRNEICSMTMATIALKFVSTKFPFLKRTPKLISRVLQWGLSWWYRLRIRLQI